MKNFDGADFADTLEISQFDNTANQGRCTRLLWNRSLRDYQYLFTIQGVTVCYDEL